MRPAHIDPRVLSLTIALLVLALPMLPVASPHQDSGTAFLEVTAEDKLLSDHEPFGWANSVSLSALPGGATGLDLLHRVAQSRGSTYTVEWFDDAAFVAEVNGVESDFSLVAFGYYWAIYEDGAYTDLAINQIVLTPGKNIQLVYEGWPVDV